MTNNIEMIIVPREYYPNNRINLRWLYEIELSEMDYKIHWIYNTLNSQVHSFKNNNNIFHINVIPNFNNITNLINYIRSLPIKYKQISSLIKNNNVKIIHVRDGIFEALISYYLAKKNGLIFSFHLSSFFSLFYKQSLNQITKSQYSSSLLKQIYYYISYKLHPVFLDYILERCDVFNPVSFAMEKKVRESNSLVNSVVTPLCVSKVISNINLKPSQDYGKYIVSSGQIIVEKGIEELIDIFQYYKEEYQDNSLNLVIIGHTPRHIYKARLQEVINKKGLDGCVFLVDELDFDEYFYILSNSLLGISIFPVTSSYYYSSPTRCIDYLMSKIPVIVNSEVPDQAKVVRESKSGLCIPNDKILISKAIAQLVNNKILRALMGNSGKKWALKNRNYSKIAISIDTAYRNLIK